jgi:mRNA interferase YafQ
VARELRSDPTIASDLKTLIALLASDSALGASFYDHKLKGNWKGHRECHLRPDLLVIYRKDPGKLNLARLGSHSALFKR